MRSAAATASTPAAPASPASSIGPKKGTAVVMLNMGGPATVPEVGPFLDRLFSDGEIIQLGPLQKWLGPLISKRRTPKIEEQYRRIGGSPIRQWTQKQGEMMVQRLDKMSPQTAPHRFYICFRYADPLTADALQQMKDDGVERAVAFSQYPQFSCTTTGSSLNHLWRELTRMQLDRTFQWSVLDRWYEHPKFIEAVVKRIGMGLDQFAPEDRSKVLIVFSAHSLPMRVVAKGDAYPQEVGATVARVMERMRTQQQQSSSSSSSSSQQPTNRYMLAWQSQVGPLPWLSPQTGEVLEGLGKQGHKHVLVVPIAFTSDHVETLFEIDVEYKHTAEKAGITHFHRSPSLNDEPLIADAMAQLVSDHLARGEVCTPQYAFNCAGCTNPICRSICNPIKPYTKIRDEVNPEGEMAKENPIKS